MSATAVVAAAVVASASSSSAAAVTSQRLVGHAARVATSASKHSVLVAQRRSYTSTSRCEAAAAATISARLRQLHSSALFAPHSGTPSHARSISTTRWAASSSSSPAPTISAAPPSASPSSSSVASVSTSSHARDSPSASARPPPNLTAVPDPGGRFDMPGVNLGSSSPGSSPSRPSYEAKSAGASPAEAKPAPKRANRFRAQKAPITLTPSAIERLRALLASPTDPRLIRISVRNKGCAGMSYHLEYLKPDEVGKFDERVEVGDGVSVLIDSKALFSIIGSEMDWKEDRLSAKFVFNNPLAVSCGCGESFAIK